MAKKRSFSAKKHRIYREKLKFDDFDFSCSLTIKKPPMRIFCRGYSCQNPLGGGPRSSPETIPNLKKDLNIQPKEVLYEQSNNRPHGQQQIERVKNEDSVSARHGHQPARQQGGVLMKTVIGLLALGIWIWFWHPEWLPAILLLGVIVFIILAVLACFCYGVEMIRLFFKI